MENLKSYDAKNKKTYIVEDGDYLFTAASDAHEATNNFLSYKGYSVDSKNSVYSYHVAAFDDVTYSKDSKTGTEITNQFDHAKGKEQKVLSRNNWSMVDEGIRDGNVLNVSSASNVGGKQFGKTLSANIRSELDSTTSLNPNPTSGEFESMSVGDTQYLVNMRGKDIDDEGYHSMVRSMSYSEIGNIIAQSGYQIPGADSISMPTSMVVDGPAGLNILPNHDSKPLGDGYYAMSWPCEIAIASSWDLSVASNVGDYIAEEGLWSNISGWYGPAMNIHRSAFSGRNFEYYSEDPYLSGTLAQEETYAAGSRGMITFIKHFALNDEETHRDTNGLIIYADEQSIRETYLKPFEMAVKVPDSTVKYNELQNDGSYVMKEKSIPTCRGIMTSYNRLGSTWAGGDYNLITNVLRNEWGFKGAVLTDWDVEGYMNNGQMLEAGGDFKLNTVGVNRTIGKDAHDSHYALAAMEHILYAVGNSSAMNGFVPNQSIVHGQVYYRYIIYAYDAVYGIVILGLAFGIIRKIKKDKKGDISNESAA